jgi:hypothetical protein
LVTGPSFHDSEVLSIRLERAGNDRSTSPVLYATLHVFALRRNDESSTGVEFFKHTLVTFRFNLVVDLELSGFNQQNVIFDLIIKRSADAATNTPLDVTFQCCYGVALAFSCQSVEVVNVESWVPTNSVYAGAQSAA